MKILTQEKWINKANKIHNNRYDYSKVNYKHSQEKVTIICPIHNEFDQIPNNHLRQRGCPYCNKRNKSNIDKFIKRANTVHNKKYTYDNVVYKDTHSKIIITCPVHGDFLQTPHKHISGSGCYKCGNVYNYTTEEFIDKAKNIHEDKYDYSKVNYKSCSDKIDIICFKHGVFKQLPSKHLSGQGCPICKASKGERAIKAILNKNNIKYIREYKIPNQIYKFRYDFYLPEYQILIEFHGKQHYEPVDRFGGKDALKETQFRDMFKKALAKELKITLLEFNYKQFKYMSREQFEELVMKSIKNRD